MRPAETTSRGLGIFGALGIAALLFVSRGEAAQTKAPAAPATPVQVELVAKGLNHPWGLQFLPDGRMLFTERAGRLRIVSGRGEVGQR